MSAKEYFIGKMAIMEEFTVYKSLLHWKGDHNPIQGKVELVDLAG